MTYKMFDLSGKTAVVTGAGSGIGQALACGLAQAGAAVVLSGRRRRNLDQTAGIIQADQGQALAVAGDLTSQANRDQLLGKAFDWRGGIDILVNCAGINLRSPAVEFPMEDWQKVLEMDLTVPFLLSQKVAAAMIQRGQGGSIINIGSLLCAAARPGIVAYTAAKGGLAQLTKALAVEWAAHRIRVNAIGPGYIHTELTQVLMDDPKFNAWVLDRTPAKRWGQPQDLVGTAILLVSPAGAFITGQIIYVDGGFLANL